MNRTMAMVATSAALVGCGAGIRSVDEASAATMTVAPMATQTSTPECLAGTWEIDAIGDADRLQDAGDIDGVTITFGDGVWSLDAVDGRFGGGVGDAVLNGSASGTFSSEDETITMQVESAAGEASLEDVAFADVVAATLPADPFHVSCDAASAQLLSDTNTAIVLTNHDPDGSVETEPARGDCLAGEWNLDGLGASAEATITGVTITFDGSTWTWGATDATVSGTLAGADIEGSFDGSATGAYVWDGDAIAVTTESAEGTVSAEFGVDATFEELLQTLVPSATVTVACDGDSATLTAGASVLALTRLSEPMEPEPPATETAASADVSGEVLEINSAGIASEYDCNGRDVAINASAVSVELHGDCPTVTINGTGNDVTIERVDVINVSGTGNDVLWESTVTASEPAVTTNGLGNQVDQA